MKSDRYLVDSNVIIRHLRQDDVELSAKASDFINDIAAGRVRGYVLVLTIHEITYVLEHVYKKHRMEIVSALKKMLEITNLHVIDLGKKQLQEMLELYGKSNVDFPDCVYFSTCLSDKMKIFSFDKDFIKLSKLK